MEEISVDTISSYQNPYFVKQFQNFSKLSGIFAIIVGFSVVIGWAFDFNLLKSINPNWISMKVNTAICFILLGASLYLKHLKNSNASNLSDLFSLICLIISLITLSEYVFSVNLGIDEIIFKESPNSVFYNNGRMAEMAAINFILSSLSILFINTLVFSKFYLSRILTAFVFISSFITIMAYSLNLTELAPILVHSHANMAIHSAITFFIISTAVFLYKPSRGIVAYAISNTLGGILIRCTLPFIIIIIPLIRWTLNQLVIIGAFDLNFSIPLFNTIILVIYSFVFFTLGKKISLLDIQKIQTEKQLQENESKFRNAMHYAPIGKALVSLNGSFTKVNKALCKIVGYSEEELLATNFQSITHPEDLEADLSLANKLYKKEIDSYEMEKRYLHKNGKIVWIQLNGSLILDSKEDPAYFIAQIQDITEKKRLAKDLQQSLTNIKEKEIQKQASVATLTHDLRTPIIAQTRLLDILQDCLGSNTNEDTQALITAVSENNQNLLKMVNKLLEIYQYEDGKINLQKELFPCNLIISESIKPIQSIIKDKSIQMVIKESRDNIRFFGDFNQLLRVFRNLIGNALEYTPNGGSITVSCFESDGFIQTEIADNGPGVDPEIRDYLFQPYLMGNNRKHKIGSGLGLYTCRLIVELHGGSIDFLPDENKGSRFIFKIPRTHVMEMDKRDA